MGTMPRLRTEIKYGDDWDDVSDYRAPEDNVDVVMGELKQIKILLQRIVVALDGHVPNSALWKPPRPPGGRKR